jgi:autoinducer 2-degrading protein
VANLHLVGTIEIAPGRRDRLISSTMAHKARCLIDEPGTLQMEVLAPREDDTKVLVYEVYRDDAAFDVHRNGPSLAQWREETAGMILKFGVTRCTPVESGASVTRT